MPNSKILILNNRKIQQCIDRIAYQMYENNYRGKKIIMAGIAKNGFFLAKRISKKLKEISPIKMKLAEIIVNKKKPLSEKARVSFPSGKVNLPEKEFKSKVAWWWTMCLTREER